MYGYERSREGHYEMMLVYYADDILVFSKDPKVIMDAIGEFYELKLESAKESDLSSARIWNVSNCRMERRNGRRHRRRI